MSQLATLPKSLDWFKLLGGTASSNGLSGGPRALVGILSLSLRIALLVVAVQHAVALLQQNPPLPELAGMMRFGIDVKRRLGLSMPAMRRAATTSVLVPVPPITTDVKTSTTAYMSDGVCAFVMYCRTLLCGHRLGFE